MPKVSIIIPVYNVEKYLRQGLDSVVNQTLSDIEIICIDDCSTDGSYEILKEYAAKDNRFVILKQDKNQGQGIARNRGIDIAKGEYIMFLDPDDWYEINTCELCYNQITKNQNDIVLFGYKKIYEQTKEIQDKTPRIIQPYYYVTSISQINLDELDTNYIANSCVPCNIYKKALLNDNNIRYHLFRNFEDHLFYAKVIIHAKTISVINKPLYNYRIRLTSSTYTFNNQQKDIFSVKKLVLEEIETSKISDNKKAAIYVYTIISSITWLDRYSEIFKPIEKDFYNSVHKIFGLMDRKFIEKNIKPRIKESIYKKYRRILKYDYTTYKLNDFSKNIFSVEKAKKYKILTIFGYKKKFYYNVSWFHFGILSFLLSWLFPTEKDKKNFRNLCNQIDERKTYRKIRTNYKNTIKKLKLRQEKIKVLFLVNDITKWKAQSLYDLMSKNNKFEPVIALNIADKQWQLTKKERKNLLQNNQKYFEDKKIKTVLAYNILRNKSVNLKKFKPDLVFYQQSRNINKVQQPKKVSDYALTIYIPYYIENFDNIIKDYNNNFHKYLYRHYVLYKNLEIEYKNLVKCKNARGLGDNLQNYCTENGQLNIYAAENILDDIKSVLNI